MEQKTPRLKLHNFSQFGLQNQSLAFHKPIDAPDYYQPKFILFFFLSFFFLKKKKKSKQIQKLSNYKGKELSYDNPTRHYKM
jgi:hypothetical protein